MTMGSLLKDAGLSKLPFSQTSQPRTARRRWRVSSDISVQERQAHQASTHPPESASTSSTMRANGKAGGTAHVSIKQKLDGNGTASKKQRAPETAVAVDYDKLFSTEAHQRLMPGLRVLVAAFHGLPGVVPLHGGLPPPEAFPFSGMTLTLKDGSKIEIEDPSKIVAAQQYNTALKGYIPLHSWVTQHTIEMHAPPSQHETIITNGSNPTLEILLRLFMEPGDSILCEEYTYPHVPESLVLPVGSRSEGMAIDEHGIIPENLRQQLADLKASGCKMPRLLYTIPVGQNPTGATQTVSRKREIYALCREYNILIIEDDPYYYLQFDGPGSPPRGLQGLGESYLAMDTDNRVMRLDSFSKILAPGMRLGWLTASPVVINKVLFHFHGVAMGACSLSQVVVSELLEKWGRSGFETHIKDIQRQYARRAGIVHAAAKKHLAGLADWAEPKAGMFMWVKLRGYTDAAQILSELQDAKVIVVPGRSCWHMGPDGGKPCPFIRISYVVSTEDELEVGVERLASVLRKYESQQKPQLTEFLMNTPSVEVPLDKEEML